MRRLYYILITAALAVSILFAFFNRITTAAYQTVDSNELIDYTCFFAPNEEGGINFSDVADLWTGSEEVLIINPLEIKTAGKDLCIKSSVTESLKTSSGLICGDEIFIFLPVYINTAGDHYLTFETHMLIPGCNREYLVFLKPYKYADPDRYFLFTDTNGSLFPCDNKINILVFSDNYDQGLLYSEIENYDCIVENSEKKEHLLDLYNRLFNE